MSKALSPEAVSVSVEGLQTLSDRLVTWQRAQGRHGLPWQNTRDPFRVWLSEIMLQQTQVRTVLDYYPRFLQRFADVRQLAAASQDEVLGLWSGLGYYSRARHLHRCAQQVVADHGGAFPRQAEVLATLPGIGRSTAAAIAAFCFDERVSILDGNVKRVLSRALAFAPDLAQARHERLLWTAADALLPDRAADMPAYTQALMDLGATVCLPRQPDCAACPIQMLCRARAAGRMLDFPVKTRRLVRKSETLWLLWLSNAQGQVWLHKRAQTGIWAGLYAFAVFDTEDQLRASLPPGAQCQVLPARVHVLTHRDLHLHPVRVQVQAGEPACAGQWVAPHEWPALGLPKPVRDCLSQEIPGGLSC